ncbi:putative F-box protein At5g62060 [Bidens hawaiensis]|uniref:putative F-box protein At5g62060 n=1 Tax=Bidens hawaiensis TaxID=980011 RepID=UPI0040494F3B
MSANIPLEIQVEIIKRVLPVKSLIRFKSVSKQWKSLIDSSEFINDHNVNQARPHHLLIRYRVDSEYKYVSIADDDNLVLPNGSVSVGFGVCPKTSDPKIVNITSDNLKAEVYTLSSRTWNSVSRNLPCKSRAFCVQQVVIDGVIYWCTNDWSTYKSRIISFDLTREEFGEVDLPDCLGQRILLRISEFNESLVVLDYRTDDSGKQGCDVWLTLKSGIQKSPYKKLLTITKSPDYLAIKGFRKNGQLIVGKSYKRDDSWVAELHVYEPGLEHNSGLGIFGRNFMMTSYTESLLN